MSIERKPGKIAQHLILTPLRAFLERRFNLTVERNDTRQMKPPYLILSNHVNNWDPLFLNCYVDEPISFVAAAPLFRNPLLRKALNYTGAIAKTKSRMDPGTIRNVLKAVRHRRVIGIFPEGNRTWDGRTEPLVYATAKLVKLLDIPVVVATIRGGYLSRPRWAATTRKGRISLSFVKLWDQGELADKTADEIHHALSEALAYDETAWQAADGTPFRGKRLAHYLERFLFVCPLCERPGKMRSEDDLFRCGACGYTVRYTEHGTLEPVTPPLRHRTLHEWDEWQLAHAARTLPDPVWQAAWDEAMRDPVKVLVSEAEQPFRPVGRGRLLWEREALLFEPGGGREPLRFPFRELDGLNVHFHHKLDFFHQDRLYRIEFYEPRTSAYKWLKLIDMRRMRNG